MSGDREAQFQAIMARILGGGKAEPKKEYNPLNDVNALVRERIERREREAQGDPLSPPSVKGGEHGEP